jgi:two-component system, NarL family, invasion response regulator UvrY
MIKILIVDDHPIVREGLKKILSLYDDIKVTGEAESANEALEKCTNNTFDLIILDISMPERSGLDIVKDLKKICSKTHILILTMHSEDFYAIRAFKSGISGYLNKGSASEQLITAIRQIMAGKKYVSPELVNVLATNLEKPSDEMLHEFLSNRELEVLCAIAKGKSIEDISNELNLSKSTIHTYRRRIFSKMRFNNNAEVIHYAIDNHLI